jgi:NADH dehydrogenase
MGRYIGKLIREHIKGERRSAPFVYRHAGSLATIGRNAAIADFGRIRLRGLAAWLFWSIAHVYFLIGARNRLSVALSWAWSYLTFQRGARLINQASLPGIAVQGVEPPARDDGNSAVTIVNAITSDAPPIT